MGLTRFSPMIGRAWRTRYDEGESLRDIANDLQEQGFDVHHMAVRDAILEVGGEMRHTREGQLLKHERNRQKE